MAQQQFQEKKLPGLEGAKQWGENSRKKKQRLYRIKYLSEDHEILKVQEKKTISKKGLIILHRDGYFQPFVEIF